MTNVPSTSLSGIHHLRAAPPPLVKLWRLAAKSSRFDALLHGIAKANGFVVQATYAACRCEHTQRHDEWCHSRYYFRWSNSHSPITFPSSRFSRWKLVIGKSQIYWSPVHLCTEERLVEGGLHRGDNHDIITFRASVYTQVKSCHIGVVYNLLFSESIL